MKSIMLKLLLALGALLLVPEAAASQGLLDKAKDMAKKTSIGKGATKLTAEAQLLDGKSYALDGRNLPEIQVGQLKLGIAGVDIKNGDAVRLKLYLFNPAQMDAAVPVPPAELFILVDEKGRRLEMLGEPSVKNLAAGAADITVPGMERVEISIIYGGMFADARTGTLKVGSTGTIAGIPIHSSVAGTASAATSPNGQPASNSPWKK